MQTSPQPKRRSRRRRQLSGLKAAIQLIVLTGILAVVGVIVFSLYSVSKRLPGMEELGLSSAATRIYSADGVLLARVYHENRDYVHLKEIPRVMQDATVAIEDDRFYTHSGLDFRGIGRALFSNVRGGKMGQGGSTITQQLARNFYDLGRQKTMGRKLQEAVVAVRLERRYTKQEILEGYLNEVYYGARAYGVQAAAMQYFGHSASKLTLPEAALLAGLPQRPTDFNPYKNVKAARERRNTVLARMAQLGYITPHEARAAEATGIKLGYLKQNQANDWKAPYFVDYVIHQLEDQYGPDMVYNGGLEVHTSLMYNMQTLAEEAVREGHDESVREHLIGPWTQAAMTCVDPHNGYIRAMVGGRNWSKSQFNRAVNNKRQPGSTFKLFVYTSAFNEGWNQYRTVNDSPKSWPQSTGKWWTPRNDDDRWRGPITIREAMALSVNMVAIKTADEIGVSKAIEVARKLGLKGDLHPYLATAIGAGGASTLEMASAYGAYAVKGQYIDPVAIVEVRDRDGNELQEANQKPVQAVQSDVVQEMDEMLRAVVTEGTGRPAAVIPDSFGKTGTTQDRRDVWFVGFTPQLATAVWVGNDDFSPLGKAWGSTVCAPVWVHFMQGALKMNPKGRPDLTNTLPAGQPDNSKPEVSTDENGMVTLKICPDSGLIATNHCPHWHSQKFKPEDAPTEACDIHPGTPLSAVASTSGVDVTLASAKRATPVDEGDASPPDTPRIPHHPEPVESDVPPPPRRPSRSVTVASIGYETVTLCADSGQLAGPYCPRTVTRRLPMGAVPTSTCRIHGPDSR